jgi:hypothetical protein
VESITTLQFHHLSIQINSFIFLHKQVKIKCQHNDKNYIDGEKGHTELVSSSLTLIAREIGKRRHFFRLLAELKPYLLQLEI